MKDYITPMFEADLDEINGIINKIRTTDYTGCTIFCDRAYIEHRADIWLSIYCDYDEDAEEYLHDTLTIDVLHSPDTDDEINAMEKMGYDTDFENGLPIIGRYHSVEDMLRYIAHAYRAYESDYGDAAYELFGCEDDGEEDCMDAYRAKMDW